MCMKWKREEWTGRWREGREEEREAGKHMILSNEKAKLWVLVFFLIRFDNLSDF